MVCLSSFMLALTGCGESGGPGGPPGAHPMGPPGAPRPSVGPAAASGMSAGIGPTAPIGPSIPHPVAKPDDKEKPATDSDENKTDNNPLAPVAKIEEAGNLVNLASEIIAANVNPFLSRLPKPLQPDIGSVNTGQPTDGGQAAPPPPPPVDPLDSVKLLGIVYNPRSPIALVAVSGAAYPSQVVRTGDVVALEAGQAIIGKISQQSINIKLLGPKPEKRTMVLPDIVGYSAANQAPAAPSGGDGSAAGPGMPGGGFGSLMGGGPQGSPQAAPPGGQQAPSQGAGSMGNGAFSNLQNLANSLMGGGNTSGNASKGQKSPNVVLTEP